MSIVAFFQESITATSYSEVIAAPSLWWGPMDRQNHWTVSGIVTHSEGAAITSLYEVAVMDSWKNATMLKLEY